MSDDLRDAVSKLKKLLNGDTYTIARKDGKSINVIGGIEVINVLERIDTLLAATLPVPDSAAVGLDREALGQIVRQAWVAYCKETGWRTAYETVCPWEEMKDEHAKEVDRRIGEAVAKAVRHSGTAVL